MVTTQRKELEVHAYPLDAMLRHLGVKTVDYLSLDTEAAQSNMMATIDFDAVEIGVISVDDALAYSSHSSVLRAELFSGHVSFQLVSHSLLAQTFLAKSAKRKKPINGS